MKSKMRSAAAVLVALVFSAASTLALATNGYFTHGVGTESKGMAGTGIGSNANMGAVMTASNPALGVFSGDGWQAGLSIFSPRRSYNASEQSSGGIPIDIGGGIFLPTHSLSAGEIDSSSEYFPIPYVAKNWSLANEGNISFAFYGRGGMNTDWDDSNAQATSVLCWNPDRDGLPQRPITGPGPYCAGDAGVDLMQAFIALNYSAMVGDNFSWGVGPVFAIQAFEATGVQTFAPVTKTTATTGDPSAVASLSNNGHDMSFGIGFAGGIWWGMTDTVSLGLAYQSKMSMGEFDDYADLFAQAGGFDIPSSVKAGLSIRATDALRINFDVEYIGYSEVDSISNPMLNLFGCPTLPLGGTSVEPCLGGEAGAGFGWEDMTIYKLGFEWQSDESNIWRFGYSHGEQPIQSADVLFNILAPGVMEQHFTLGWTRMRSNGSAWNVSFMYAPENTVTGPSFFDPLQTIDLKMSQIELEISYSW
ncbi:MAG: outer membrane protein transport protein [Gammaproteobacteria bacterium]|nr:outer membrane protein transport protein [Gammaproteobacteria bacterium]